MQRMVLTLLAGIAVVAVTLASPLRSMATAQQPAATAPPAPQNNAQAPPAFPRAADALERVSWRTRTLVGDEKLTRWKLAVRPDAPTFQDGVVRTDALVVDYVEGRNGQRVSSTLSKPLDQHLTADEIASIRKGMGATVKMLTYRTDTFGSDAATRKAVLQFAKAMGADTVVVPGDTAVAGLGALADEAGVNVALLVAPDKLASVVSSLSGQSARVGVGIDTGAWLEAGKSPVDALAAVGDRLKYVNLRDRAALGASSKNVRLGEGAGKLPAFFDELNKKNIRPLAMTLDTTGIAAAPADQFAAVDAFEKTVQPTYGRFFTEFSKTRPTRWDLVTPNRGETLTAEQIKTGSDDAKQKIEAALPKQPYAKPKKARTLLVIESLHGMSHNTIPHTNVMLQRFGELTGAWKTVFSNDLTNLMYPKIKEYDAIFLNDIVGEAFADLAVREGLSRYTKEGGGIIGIHGTPWASRNWNEFAEIIGAQDAPHRIEQGIMHVYDPANPIAKPLGGKDINFKEEYYRFNIEGSRRLRWNNVRVLLTVSLDDLKVEPRPWTGYTRSDHIYPVSWIRTYGKGRVFYSSLGHMPETFMTPNLVGHFIAGVQYALGDLDADATPNPPSAASFSSH
jgi:type 1 glutamine amidotransferase/sugar phosphate isomerase/epimerase